jgi:ferredoxin-nitrate reductase
LTDRIANRWGERTLFGRDNEWPVRVDQFLKDGISENEVNDRVQVGLHPPLQQGRHGRRRQGRSHHRGLGRFVGRANKGRLGPKDLFGWQTPTTPRTGRRSLWSAGMG